MAEYAHNYIRKTNRHDVEVLYLTTSEAWKAADIARENNARIIITSGTIAQELKRHVELKALLDYSSNGIIIIDTKGFIVGFNNRSLSLLDKSQDEVERLNITTILPALADQQIFTEALFKGEDAFLTFWHTSGIALSVNIIPLLVNNEIEGAILSFHEINMLKQMKQKHGEISIRILRPGTIMNGFLPYSQKTSLF